MQDVHYSPCSLRLVLMGFAFQQGGVKPEHDSRESCCSHAAQPAVMALEIKEIGGSPGPRGEPGCSSEVERGSNPVSSEAVGGCAQALEAPKRGQVPPEGSGRGFAKASQPPGTAGSKPSSKAAPALGDLIARLVFCSVRGQVLFIKIESRRNRERGKISKGS